MSDKLNLGLAFGLMFLVVSIACLLIGGLIEGMEIFFYMGILLVVLWIQSIIIFLASGSISD
jgi:hypothetical protein